jgi:hypothetical protein
MPEKFKLGHYHKAGKLYIRSKVGYRKPPKKLADLPEGESFVLFWYEGKTERAKAVGRFADKAQTALINKEAALRRASVTGAVPAPAPEAEKAATSGRDFPDAVNLYLSEVKRGKSKKTHFAYNITSTEPLAIVTNMKWSTPHLRSSSPVTCKAAVSAKPA